MNHSGKSCALECRKSANSKSSRNMKTKTLWTNEERKFKPRNKQAALICIPAKGFHIAPIEPQIAKTMLQRIADENAERELRVATLKTEKQAREKANKELMEKREKKRISKKMKRVAEKQARDMARLSQKIARKISK